MKLIKDMLILMVIAGAIGLCANLFLPRGFVLVGRSSIDERRIVQISAEEAKIKYDSEKTVFIDARGKDEYAYARIPGSVNIPSEVIIGGAATDSDYGQAARRLLSRSEYPFFNKPVELVIYCDGVGCGAAETLGKKIIRGGYARTIYILNAGFPGWESSGYPVERGE